MTSLYSNEISEFLHSRPWPKGLEWEIVEYEEPEPHLYIVFSQHNWNQMTYEEMLITTSIVEELMHKIWLSGVPIYLERTE